MAGSASAATTGGGRLGTFAGVFTPSILTILGIILFLRLGYVVGGSGLAQALLIIALANLLSLVTSSSLAAVATNMKVKAGGDYYLISRTLGPGFGGAIGLVVFLAQSVSIGFYCVGFAEATAAILNWHDPFAVQAVGAAALLALFVLAWLGADWATRFQYVVMALIAVALVSFFVGAAERWDISRLAENWERPAGGLPFWVAFAIFFPAVTGFTQGVSMSGDLREAGRSIPRGTFAAVGFSCVIYFAVAILFAAALPGSVLAGDYQAMKTVSALGVLIDGGVVAATLSSALASFLGAPRVLQSLARDRLFPGLKMFAKGHGSASNPRRGTLLAGAIALAVTAVGNLNAVAAVVSMFFLISYGLLNLATYYEIRAGSPSFRPSFRWYDRRLSLLGGVGCVGVMLAIDAAAGLVAVAVAFAIYQYLVYRGAPARWADSRRSFHLQQARDHLIAATAETEHPRDWRPVLLVFSDDSRRRERLLRFASWIEGRSGMTTVIRVLQGEGAPMLERRAETAEALAKELRGYDLAAFPLVVVDPDLDSAIPTILQSTGVGPLRINTVVVNWLKDSPAFVGQIDTGRYGRNLRTAFRLGCNLVVLDADDREWAAVESRPPEARVIDIWWAPGSTGELMLVLAHLMMRDETWAAASVRILATADGADPDSRRAELTKMLDEARIDAEPLVVAGDSVHRLVEASHDSTIVFLPFAIRGGRFFHPFGGEIMELLPDLPVAVLVTAAQDFALDADPDEGTAGEAAALRDRLADADERLRAAEKLATDAAAAAEEANDDLVAAVQKGEAAAVAEGRKKVTEAQGEARRAARNAARLSAVKETLENRAREAGIDTDEP